MMLSGVKPSEFIKDTYEARYGARLETFPSRIIALLDHRNEPFSVPLAFVSSTMDFSPNATSIPRSKT